jgi:hypothetical protein
MYEEYSPPVTPEITEWAMEAARSTRLARTMAKVCFLLAGLSLTVGLIGAITSFLYVTDQSAFGGPSGETTLALAQASNVLLNGLLPAGLLAAAGAFLRVYAVRFETDLYVNDEADDPEGGDDATTV